MMDLKQRLIDILRIRGISVGDTHNTNTHDMYTSKASHKPKKLHEYTADDCNAAFLRKYYEVGEGGFNAQNNGVIYFNDNLTMTSKYDMRQFPMNRYASCLLSTLSNSDDSVLPLSSKSDKLATTDETGSRYESTSDEDRTTLVDYCICNNVNNVQVSSHNCCDTDAFLDSFCTLCTSSFSYNKCCRYCDNSQCGSKCNSECNSHTTRRSRRHIANRTTWSHKKLLRILIKVKKLYKISIINSPQMSSGN